MREQNESDKVLIKGDSMSVRRILAKTINTDLEYEAIGIEKCSGAMPHNIRHGAVH